MHVFPFSLQWAQEPVRLAGNSRPGEDLARQRWECSREAARLPRLAPVLALCVVLAGSSSIRKGQSPSKLVMGPCLVVLNLTAVIPLTLTSEGTRKVASCS